MKRKSFEHDTCPVARSLEAVGDVWSMLVVREAVAGKRRFGEFGKGLGIAQKILKVRLDGKAVLSPAVVAEATKPRISGPDKVPRFDISWAAGLMRNEGLNIFAPTPGHRGPCAGGRSCAIADAALTRPASESPLSVSPTLAPPGPVCGQKFYPPAARPPPRDTGGGRPPGYERH